MVSFSWRPTTCEVFGHRFAGFTSHFEASNQEYAGDELNDFFQYLNKEFAKIYENDVFEDMFFILSETSSTH